MRRSWPWGPGKHRGRRFIFWESGTYVGDKVFVGWARSISEILRGSDVGEEILEERKEIQGRYRRWEEEK